jgi:glutathione S-transferase
VVSDFDGARVPIYHLALRSDWEAAVTAGEPYAVSTLGSSLDEVGYLHCSYAPQVQGVADLVYRGRDDVLLLTIDPGRVRAKVRPEDLTGAGEAYPHVYGPLDLEAVVAVRALVPDDGGRLDASPG